MAPKAKVSSADIVQTAIEIIRQNGEGAINARSIAASLNCSTQPIFSNFATMEELQAAVALAAYERYSSFLQNEVNCGKYPPYKAYGMAYIRFAKEEKELFKLLFMCDRKSASLVPTNDFSKSVEMIKNANGITQEKAELMHLEMWTCVHGIGTMLATSFLSLDWELISDILTDVYQGIRARHLSEEKKS